MDKELEQFVSYDNEHKTKSKLGNKVPKKPDLQEEITSKSLKIDMN